MTGNYHIVGVAEEVHDITGLFALLLRDALWSVITSFGDAKVLELYMNRSNWWDVVESPFVLSFERCNKRVC